jgi:hypothetical protein
VALAAFLQALKQLGWIEGRNIRIDNRWGAGDANTLRKYAAEFAVLAPDVILAIGAAAAPMLQASANSYAPCCLMAGRETCGGGTFICFC